jgi:hypothetical protein
MEISTIFYGLSTIVYSRELIPMYVLFISESVTPHILYSKESFKTIFEGLQLSLKGH